MVVSVSERPPIDAIRRFWRWFVASAERLKSLYSTDRLESLASEVNRELDKIEPELAWEMGPGKKKPYLLTISGEGNPRLRELADLMIGLAPVDLVEWELYAARPARPAPRIVRLPEGGEIFETREWKFIPFEHHKSGRLDLVIVDDQLARSHREAALRAVSLYLDQVLGEDTVEAWIGEFRVESSVVAHGKRVYEIANLPDYLLSVTRREQNPLRKPTN
jgi:hypothetical protein